MAKGAAGFSFSGGIKPLGGQAGSAGFWWNIRGMTELLRLLEDSLGLDIGSEFEEAVEEALSKFVHKPSLALCPIDTGSLRDSSGISVTRAHGRIRAFVYYGGPQPTVQDRDASQYAVYVHERLDVAHDPPTQAKFLEQPFNDNRDKLVKAISYYVRKNLLGTARRPKGI